MSGIRRNETKRFGVFCEVCHFADEVEFSSGNYREDGNRWQVCKHKNADGLLVDECPNWIAARKGGVPLD